MTSYPYHSPLKGDKKSDIISLMNRQRQKPTLTDRAKQVLSDVVNIHSKSGQPVGSKILSEESALSLSGASFRNVMQDLEKQGMLTHPHTSAGRIPTPAGYRFFAQNIVTSEGVDATLKSELEKAITSQKDINEAIKTASDLLQQMTGCASIITTPKRNADTLETIEFVRLSGDRVLAVIVTDSGDIQNRVIEVPAFVEADDLNKASKDLKQAIAGQTLDGARDNMIAMIAEQKGRVNAMIDQMMLAAHEWGEPTVNDGAMVVAGSTNLFQYPELVREKLQGLVKMFEEKRLLMSLMEEVRNGDGVQVFIGKDNPLSAQTDCAIIAKTYGVKEKDILGTLGVIGPQRMDYQNTISLVNYTSELLTKMVTKT